MVTIRCLRSRVLLCVLVAALSLLYPLAASADQQSPTWWDPDGVAVGHDWHYRVWVTVTADQSLTRPYVAQHAMDFSATGLSATLGVTGVFDPASLRVVYTVGAQHVVLPCKWADADADGRGVLSWTLDDDGVAATPFALSAGAQAAYAVYWDILENCGPKPAAAPQAHTMPDVAVYADNNGWWIPAAEITQVANALSASLTSARSVTVFRQNAADHAAIVAWATARLGDGVADILIILDCTVETLWSGQADASLLERWIDDGNTIIWTGDYAFYAYRDLRAGQDSHRVVGTAGDDRVLDISPVHSRNASYTRTADGARYLPSLPAMYSGDSRPLRLTSLGSYVVDASFACDSAGYCDAIVIHNPVVNGGYFAQMGMSRSGNLPGFNRAKVITEFVHNWLLGQGQSATVTQGPPEGLGVDITALTNLTSGQSVFVCSDRLGVQATADAGLCLDSSAGRTMAAELLDAQGTVRDTAILYDDATHGDAVANDAQWANTQDLTLPASLGADGGTWTVRVSAGSAPLYDNGYLASDSAPLSVAGIAANVHELSLAACQGGEAALSFQISNLGSQTVEHIKASVTQSLTDGSHTILNSNVSLAPTDLTLGVLEQGRPVTLTIAAPVGQAPGTYHGQLTLWADADDDGHLDDCLSTTISLTLVVAACGASGFITPQSLDAIVSLPCPCVDGLQVYHVYRATNLGGVADRGNIALLPAASQGWAVTVLRDVNGDDTLGTFAVTQTAFLDDVAIAYSADGSGGSGGWDWVNPATDTGSDGVPDTGDLAGAGNPGAAANIVVRVTIPCGDLADTANFLGLSIYSHNDWVANHSTDPYDSDAIMHGLATNVTTVAGAPCGMITPRSGAVSVEPCDRAYFVQRWEQMGAAPDRGNISVAGNPRGWPVRLYKDVQLDNTPGSYAGDAFTLGSDDKLIASDLNGDGNWDAVAPAYDTGDDGIPDTGVLGPYGGYAQLVWELEAPCGCAEASWPGAATLTARGSSHADWANNHPTLAYDDDAVFHDETPLTMTIEPHPDVHVYATPVSLTMLPGQESHYVLTLENAGNVLDTFAFTAHSSRGYTVTLYADDCLTPISDLGGAVGPDVVLTPCTSISLCLGIQAPPDVLAGVFDTTVVTFTSSVDGAVAGAATLQGLAITAVEGLITPRDLEDEAYPGQSAFYCQEWRNGGSVSDRGNLALVPDQGWCVSIWRDVLGDSPLGVVPALGSDDVLFAEDCDGDGLFEYVNPLWDTGSDGIPDTGNLAADPDGAGPLRGGAMQLIVQVRVPDGAPANSTDALVVRGFSHNDWTTRAPTGPYNDASILFHDQVSLYTVALGTDLAITVQPWLPWPCPGWNETYTILVTNTSDSTLTQVTVTDTFPVGTWLAPTGVTAGYTEVTGGVTWRLAELAPGASEHFDVTIHVSSGAAVGALLLNRAEVGALELDRVYTDTAEISVISCQDLEPTITPTLRPTITRTPTVTVTPQPTILSTTLYLPLALK